MTAATPRRLPLPGCPASLSNLAPALLPLLLGWPYRQHPSGSGWRSSAGRRPCHPMIEARRVEPWARTPDCEEYYWEGAATPWEGAATPPDHPPAPLNGGFRCAWATVSGAHGQRVEGTRVGPSSGPLVRDAPARDGRGDRPPSPRNASTTNASWIDAQTAFGRSLRRNAGDRECISEGYPSGKAPDAARRGCGDAATGDEAGQDPS
jgi:hypothetical protein